MKDLEARKRALAVESEAYRQMLGMEIRTLRLHGEKLGRKLSLFRSVSPLFSLGAPLLGALWRRRQPKWLRFAKAGFAGWQLYRKFGPVLDGFFSQFNSSPRSEAAHEEESASSAEI